MKGWCIKKVKGDKTTKPNWLELPIDLTKNILQRLDTVDIVTSARNVCHLWWNIFKDPLMWRTIHMCDFRFLPSLEKKICCYAIDLSCGHLEDIAISWFGTDELLKYIAHRARHLRRLKLFHCNDISERGLGEFVKRFSLLEELVICRSSNSLSKDSLEIIGRCCPLLKSLNLERLFPLNLYGKSDEAFAIPKTMSGLRHLNLIGIRLSYVGLLAILDRCPRLESLDLECSTSPDGKSDEAFAIAKTIPGLRHLKLNEFCLNYDELLAILEGCPVLESLDLRRSMYYNFDSKPSLRKRCCEQIKDFRPPMLFT